MGKLRLVFVFCRTNLYHWSKTANLDEYWLSGLWIISEIALAGFVLVAGFQDFLHFRLKALVEILHPVGPFGLSFCNIIKLLLYVCRKVVVHDVREVLHQEIVYYDADISRQKLALFRACHLFLQLLGYLDALQRIYGKCALFTRLVTLYHVLTLLDGTDGWSIGRWTADAEIFQFLHQTGLCVSCRSQRILLCSKDFSALQFIAFFQGWKNVGRILSMLFIVG